MRYIETRDGLSVLKRSVYYAACLFLVLLLIWYVYTNRQDFHVVRNFSLGVVGFVLLLTLARIAVGCYFTKIVAGALGVNLDVTDWLGVPALSNVLALVLPLRGDLVVKGVYYKHKCGMSYGKYLSLTMGGMVLLLIIYALDMICCLVLWDHTRLDANLAIAISLLSLSGMSGFIWAAINRRDWIISVFPLKQYSTPLIIGLYEVLKNATVVKYILVTIIFNNVLGIICIYSISKVIVPDVFLYQAILYYCIFMIISHISIIPGNIGITEFLTGLASAATGNIFSYGILISLMMRVTSIIVYIGLTLLFSFPLAKKIRGLKAGSQVTPFT